MSEQTAEQVRELSHVLFGQRYRLEVMAAVASSSDGLVSLGELAAGLGVTPSNIQKPLRDLVAAGLLTRMPHGDSKRRYYRRNQSLGWPFALEMVRLAEGGRLRNDLTERPAVDRPRG